MEKGKGRFSNASNNSSLMGDPAMQHPVNGFVPVKSIQCVHFFS